MTALVYDRNDRYTDQNRQNNYDKSVPHRNVKHVCTAIHKSCNYTYEQGKYQWQERVLYSLIF